MKLLKLPKNFYVASSKLYEAQFIYFSTRLHESVTTVMCIEIDSNIITFITELGYTAD